MESNPIFTWAFAPSNFQNMHCMGKYSNYKKLENTFPQLFIATVPQFRFHENRVKNVCSSSNNPNTYITIIFTNLKNWRKKCYKMWETSKNCQSQVKGLT
jgi:hypothetical protein